MKRKVLITTAAVVSFLLMPSSAYGGGHTWRVNEIFSNPNGKIQFIELQECCSLPGEYLVSQISSNLKIFSLSTISCGGCSTANANLLIATQGFADLPGAPMPDYIMPIVFFNVLGDTVDYSIYHSVTFGPVPINGVNSLDVAPNLIDTDPAINSPTNLNGDTAIVNARCKVADFNFTGGVDVTDLLELLSEWGPCPPPCNMDLDFNGNVNVTDLLTLLADWGDCI